MNQLILGDNLEVLKNLESESVDLIYLDPPFFSNRNYEVIWGDAGEVRSFQDRWAGGVDHYISWLKERVEEMYRLLKPTGSMYFHCDHHANAYIRVYILDKIFGARNFRNEIIWVRGAPKSNSKQGSKHFGRTTDTIFLYSKSNKYLFNHQFRKYSVEELKKKFKYKDKNGSFCLHPLDGPGGAAKGNPKYEFLNVTRYWRYTQENMNKLLLQGKIWQNKEGNVPMKKVYESESKGFELQNFWNDIKNLRASNSESIGYPTQKPEALLERIIKASSNEGDVVLDPFMGGGTTIAVADKLKRKWLGIDQSVQAVKVTELRLQRQKDLFSEPFSVQLHKYDYDTLRYQNAFKFETWIIQQFGGEANTKQRSDLGIDGKKESIPIQVKRSDNVGRNVIDNFTAAIRRFDKSLFEKNKSAKSTAGYIIAFSFGKGAVQEVARLKNEEDIIIELIVVKDIVPIAQKPKLKVSWQDLGLDKKEQRMIAFAAVGESNTGIEFYSWDWNYNFKNGFQAAIMFDKLGNQKQSFAAGGHKIAVKVVDGEGLESVEVLELRVNGAVKIDS